MEKSNISAVLSFIFTNRFFININSIAERVQVDYYVLTDLCERASHASYYNDFTVAQFIEKMTPKTYAALIDIGRRFNVLASFASQEVELDVIQVEMRTNEEEKSPSYDDYLKERIAHAIGEELLKRGAIKFTSTPWANTPASIRENVMGGYLKTGRVNGAISFIKPAKI